MGKHIAPQTSDSALAELRAALGTPDVWPTLGDAVTFLRDYTTSGKHGITEGRSLIRNAYAMRNYYRNKGTNA